MGSDIASSGGIVLRSTQGRMHQIFGQNTAPVNKKAKLHKVQLKKNVLIA